MENIDHRIIDILNEAIDEDLGINQEVDAEAARAAKSIMSNLNGKNAYEKDSIPRKEHTESATIGGKTVKFHVTQYFFNSEEEKNKFLRKHIVQRGWVQQMRWICLPIFMVNGEPEEDIFDFLYHEVEHAFQNNLMGHGFGGGNKYAFAISNLNSGDENLRAVCSIVYITTKSEQEGFANGAYGALKHNSNILTLDDDFKKTDAYQWLKLLHAYIEYVETHPECESIIRGFGQTREKFIKFAKESERDYLRRLTRILYKLKTQVFEGYRPHIGVDDKHFNEGYMFHVSY